MANQLATGTIEANGTKLYYELRGAGPSLLFVPGAEGDAEEFAWPAELLAEEFTVLTYDRRAFSRSPRPADFTGTSVDEQADDAAALLAALDLAPAGVWGNSSGAIIGLSLVLRHPEVVRKAMLHEPPLFAGLSDPAEVIGFLKQSTVNGKVPFLRMLTGDVVYDGFSSAYRARLLADDTWIKYEFDKLEYYRPTDEDLAKVQRPIGVLFGADSAPFFGEIANWLTARLGTHPLTIPGGHGVHYEYPEEVAKAIREFMTAD